MAKQQFCTFQLNTHWFGVEVLCVQEILRYHDVTPIPMAPNVVEGLINLRGQIVTAIDLGQLLGLEASHVGDRRMNIIVHGSDSAFSLLVDAIGDVLELDDALAEPPPDTLHGVARELISHTYKLEKSLLSTINVEVVIEAVATNVRTAA